MARAVRFLSLGVLLCSVAGIAWTGSSAPRPESGGWWQAAIENIRRSEYRFSVADGGGWTAPSRSQGLRSFVSDDGLKLVPFPAGGRGSPWELELAIVGFGRGDRLGEPGVPRKIAGDGHRVELIRERLTEDSHLSGA